MVAAEITDKLGLHSLRQRAWVSPQMQVWCRTEADNHRSTYNPRVLHPVTVSMRAWNG